MKVIDKYFTALERDDFEGFKACVGETRLVPGDAVGSNAFITTAPITEEDFAKAKSEIAVLPDNEKNRVKASFVGRHNIVTNTYEDYWITVDLTFYNDSSHETICGENIYVTRMNGKWIIAPNLSFEWACGDPDYSALYQIYSESVQ